MRRLINWIRGYFRRRRELNAIMAHLAGMQYVDQSIDEGADLDSLELEAIHAIAPNEFEQGMLDQIRYLRNRQRLIECLRTRPDAINN
jgi:hypothetical protein